jgi:hypothetical protein
LQQKKDLIVPNGLSEAGFSAADKVLSIFNSSIRINRNQKGVEELYGILLLGQVIGYVNLY